VDDHPSYMDEFLVEPPPPKEEITDPLQGSLFSNEPPLSTLRNEFREGCKEGTTCPVCERWGHYDGRKLNVTMVRALAWMWKLSNSGRNWVDVPEALRNDERTYDFSKQYSTVRHWDFLDHKPNDGDSTAKESGVWRPTPLAGEFLRGDVAVPERIWTFNAKRVLVSDVKVVVGDIVSGFDYWEMMREYWPPF
jgi:hypothetical protein